MINKKTAIKLGLWGKILSLAGTLLIMLTTIGTVNYIYLSGIGEELKSIAEEDLPLTTLITEIESNQMEQSILLEKILKLAHQSGFESEIKKLERTSSSTCSEGHVEAMMKRICNPNHLNLLGLSTL